MFTTKQIEDRKFAVLDSNGNVAQIVSFDDRRNGYVAGVAKQIAYRLNLEALCPWLVGVAASEIDAVLIVGNRRAEFDAAVLACA